MDELALKYGCNPNQKPARVFMEDGPLPFKVLNGKPGYINLLDALNSWQLVSELKEATGLPAAASFKHVSPAGAAVSVPLSSTLEKVYFVEGIELSPIATAYTRARGADRMSSYGDFVALSDECDEQTASFLKREVSDGVIAPSYTDEALAILKEKRKGTYLVLQMDPAYRPAPLERKQVFGVWFEQQRNDVKITEECLQDIPTQAKTIPADARRDLLVALITLKYTQSNSVCYAKDGQAVGIGAGPAVPRPLHAPRGKQGGQLVPAPVPRRAQPPVPGRRAPARPGQRHRRLCDRRGRRTPSRRRMAAALH